MSPRLATNRSPRLAAPGDLLLVLGDDVRRCWKQIIYFDAAGEGAAAAGADDNRPPSIDLPDLDLGDDVELIRDERGVRLARPESEGDD